jgi:hypothetical protein
MDAPMNLKIRHALSTLLQGHSLPTDVVSEVSPKGQPSLFVFGDGEKFARVFEIDGRRDHARDTGGAGTLEHGGQIRVKLAAAEVGVGVEEHVRPGNSEGNRQ